MPLHSYFLRYLFVVLFCLYLPFAQVGRSQSPALVKVGVAGGIVALTGFGWSFISGIIEVSTQGRWNWAFQLNDELIRAKSQIDRDDLVHSLDTALRRYGFLRARSLRKSIDEELYVDMDNRVLQVKIKRNNRYRVRFVPKASPLSIGLDSKPPFNEYLKLHDQYATKATPKEKGQADKKSHSGGLSYLSPMSFNAAISVIKKLDQANLAMEQGLFLQPREGMLSLAEIKTNKRAQ